MKLHPHGPVISEDGDLHHGVIRIHDPDGNPVSISEKPFGVIRDQRIPGIRHIAYNTMDPEGMREVYSKVFGFVEVPSDSSIARQAQIVSSATAIPTWPSILIYNLGSNEHEINRWINIDGREHFDVRQLIVNTTLAVEWAI